MKFIYNYLFWVYVHPVIGGYNLKIKYRHKKKIQRMFELKFVEWILYTVYDGHFFTNLIKLGDWLLLGNVHRYIVIN